MPAHEATTVVVCTCAPLPNMYNPDKLAKYTEYQIGWWDESHRKCCLKTIQGANGCDVITRVRRDEKGNPTKDGIKSKDSPVNVNVKYEKEVRFALGVALVTYPDGTEAGLRIPLFEYTEQTILAHRDWNTKLREEMNRVKGLQSGGRWVVSGRGENAIYESDGAVVLKGVGKRMAELLNTAGITNLISLKARCNNPEQATLLVAMKGITARKLELWKAALVNLIPGDSPPRYRS